MSSSGPFLITKVFCNDKNQDSEVFGEHVEIMWSGYVKWLHGLSETGYVIKLKVNNIAVLPAQKIVLFRTIFETRTTFNTHIKVLLISAKE